MPVCPIDSVILEYAVQNRGFRQRGYLLLLNPTLSILSISNERIVHKQNIYRNME